MAEAPQNGYPQMERHLEKEEAMDDRQRARIVRLRRSGVPSSHIARRLGVRRREVNRAMRSGRRTDG